MNYTNLYNQLLDKYGSIEKDKSKTDYRERHHILPKSMGGSNDKNNLVYLPARVHFICHRILCKIYPDSHKLKFAFWAMSNQLYGDVTREYKVTSYIYNIAKIEFSKANSKLHSGKKLSENHLKIIRDRMIGNTINKKGSENPNFGKNRSLETINKIKETKLKNPEKNCKFKGYYLTPCGKFSSGSKAAIANNCDIHTIRKYCLNNANTKVTSRMVKDNLRFTSEQVGLLLQELGWDFLPKD